LTETLAAGLTLAVLAALLSGLLLLAGRWLAVAEDARLERLVSLLPGINCGSCGRPGCRAFASALLAREVAPANCPVSTRAAQQAMADLLQVEVGASERRVARLACAGDRDLAPALARYAGETRCASAAVVAEGGRSCAWGCLGLGDCERACGFDAITMTGRGLPVVDEARCTACGDCVRACPKDLFHIVPQAQPLWVACSNPQAGSQLVETCRVACTACGRCVQDAPTFLHLDGNLPRLLATAQGTAPRAAIERCPTGAIVWFSQGKAQAAAGARRPPATAPDPTAALHGKPA